MLKVYADPSLGVTKGQFKRPSGGLNMTFDCGRYSDSDSTSTQEEVVPFPINN
jgi:hypothetical protein